MPLAPARLRATSRSTFTKKAPLSADRSASCTIVIVFVLLVETHYALQLGGGSAENTLDRPRSFVQSTSDFSRGALHCPRGRRRQQAVLVRPHGVSPRCPAPRNEAPPCRSYRL